MDVVVIGAIVCVIGAFAIMAFFGYKFIQIVSNKDGLSNT